MFLAIDIGNTLTHVAIAESENDAIDSTWRFSSSVDRTADECESLLSVHLPSEFGSSVQPRIAVCSVVPLITDAIVQWSRQYLRAEPLVVSPDIDLGIRVATSSPDLTGQDRIANAAAAFARHARECIIVDMGTATKIDVVERDGTFPGGAIAPGLGLSMESLTAKAARLAPVPLELPDSSIGASTQDALQAGVVRGHLKMVEGLIDESRKQLGGKPVVILTGGYAPVFVDAVRTAVDSVDPNLTLTGLQVISRLNAR